MSLEVTKVERMRQPIRDLPLPPEVAAEAKRCCDRLYLFWTSRKLAKLHEELKVQYYYGGRCIAYLRTKEEGLVVVAVADSVSDPALDRQLAALTPEERRSRVLSWPRPFLDEESILG